MTLKGTFEATLTKVENVLKAHGLFSSKIKSIVEGFSMLFRLLEAANLSRKVLFHAGLVGDIQVPHPCKVSPLFRRVLLIIPYS